VTIIFKIHYMFISEYIFVIKSFRRMGVGGEGKAPQDFDMWHFSINFFAKKVVFLLSSGENAILPLLTHSAKLFLANTWT